MAFCVTHLRPISYEVLKTSIRKMRLQNSIVELLPLELTEFALVLYGHPLKVTSFI